MGKKPKLGLVAIGLGMAVMASMADPAHSQEIRLTGRVVERATLNPVPGAVVRLAAGPEAADTTGSDGRFAILRASSALEPTPFPSPLPLAGNPEGGSPGWDASGRQIPDRWRPVRFRPHVQGGQPRNLPVTSAGAREPSPARKAGGRYVAGAPPSADRLDITHPGLQGKSVDVIEFVKELGDIVLEYPARKLGVGVPPIYGSIRLFDGTRATLDAEWHHWMGTYRINNGLAPTPITWTMVNDPVDSGMVMRTCCRFQWGDEDLVTKRKFRDFQVHLEFNLVSAPRTGTGAGPANSGVYLQSLYEIQIRDDYGKSPLGNHDAGAILNEFAAPVNLGKPRGQWQAYDITFRAARFSAGRRTEKARLTMHWNGTLVHLDRETANEHNTGVSSDSLTDGPKGFKLQSEGHDVRFRNVWIKDLDLPLADTKVGY